MDPLMLGAAAILLLLLLIIMGMPVALVLIGLSFAGIWFLRDSFDLALRLLSTASYTTVADYVFVAIPLFVLMGALISDSDIGRDTFNALERLFRKAKAGLAISTVASNAVFGAVTGVSVASAAVFSRVAVPEMVRHGYRDGFAAGTVAGSSILGMLVPPSLLLIVYGVLAEQSIGRLFVAAIVPGILMAVAFAAMILALAGWWPGQVFAKDHPGPAAGDNQPDHPSSLMALMPIAFLIVLVLGGIYGGYFSPTEAGAVGAFGAGLLAWQRGRLSRARISAMLRETANVSASILLLLVAASMYGRMLTYTGLPQQFALLLGEWGIGYWSFLLIYAFLVLVAGMFLDSISIMLIFLPIVLPVAEAIGIDPIQFGVLTIIAVEMGLISPPFGLSVYVVQSTLKENSIGIGKIFLGTSFFLLPMALVFLLIAAVPQLTSVLI